MVSAIPPPAERRVRKHTSSVVVDLRPKIGSAVKRVLRAGGSDFRFPVLTGDEAAALMQAAGIVNENGKLAKKYR